MWLIGVSGRQILGCALRRRAASAAPDAVAAPAAAVCCEPTHRGTCEQAGHAQGDQCFSS